VNTGVGGIPGSGVDDVTTGLELDVNLGQKMTWSTSFERRNMECIGCAQHLNTTAFQRRGTGGKGGLQAIWLTDQSMPPILPSTTQLSCVKIVRLEHGMLSDMAEGLVRLLSRRQVAPGSVILLCLATNMAAVRTAAYIADLMAAIKHLRVHLGNHLLYGPLPCTFLNACDGAATLRTAFKVSTWVVTAFDRSYALVHNSFRLVDQQLTTRGAGGIQAEYRYRQRLPLANRASISTGATITMVSGCWDNLPNKVKPATVRVEKEVVYAIIEELRGYMAIDLETHPTVDRWPPALVKPAGGGGPRRTFLLVGSSHAGKIAAALRTSGHHTEVIYEPSWRANRDSVLNLATMIHDKLQEVKVDAVVLCLVDNNTYYGLTDAGETSLPKRDKEGHYHVEGDLIVCSKSAQHALFKLLTPIFDATSHKTCILMSPVPRYLQESCC
jgi:hypothetical protein